MHQSTYGAQETVLSRADVVVAPLIEKVSLKLAKGRRKKLELSTEHASYGQS